MKSKIHMTWDKETYESPIGNAYEVALDKPVDHFGKAVYKVVLFLDHAEHEAIEQMNKPLDKFHKVFSKEVGIPVQNKVVYTSDKGNKSITFTVSDRGHSPDCFDDKGNSVDPPSNGDRISVRYSIAGWYDEEKAGIKVYLQDVIVHHRLEKKETKELPKDFQEWLD